ncbi:10459_t:CDS:10, partial [Acaulospora morrowiae]
VDTFQYLRVNIMDPNQPTKPVTDESVVLQYLAQMGYKQTELMFRQEAARVQSNEQIISDFSTPYLSLSHRSISPEEYKQSYLNLKKSVEQSMDKFKGELQAVLYPIFVHVYLEQISKSMLEQATEFFNEYQSDHITYDRELKALRVITQPHHVQENELAQKFRTKKFTVRMTITSYQILIDHLQDDSLLLRIVNRHLNIESQQGTIGGGSSHTDIGIPSYSSQELEEFNRQEVQLGHLPMDPALRDEVKKTLTEEDNYRKAIMEAEYNAESDGQQINGVPDQYSSLQQEFVEKIRKEQSSDAPDRASIPLPSYKGADVHSQVELVKDMTQRIKLGPSVLPSVCFYTFHNTNDSLNCLSISEDSSLIAGGFSDSYIKIWSLKGEKLRGFKSQLRTAEINSVYDLENVREESGSDYKKLLGHSGPVLGLSFSPDKRYLISCSEDRTARLWSTDTYTNLVSYKGHNSPVWDVNFSPVGFYFATAGHDRTARLWSCDHIYPLRIFVGHMSDVDCIRFHPNSKYIITGSSDKSVRMWDVQRGSCFRIFSGHTRGIHCLAISSDGRLLASGGEDKSIIIWDLGTGKQLKKMTGHTDIIYSLDFSKEDNILVSGSADNTVRMWDVKKGISNGSNEDDQLSLIDKQKTQENGDINYSFMKSDTSSVVASQDLLTVLPTKKTPVYKIHFTGRNLCLAAGAYSASEEEKLDWEQKIKSEQKKDQD